MTGDFDILTRTGSAEETRALGAKLGELLQPGDVVLLSGELGAGKTQLVQGVARGLGADETPISPTFNIALSYSSGRIALHHLDLYRLKSAAQLEDVGLREYLEGPGACFVEWAEKFPSAFDEHLAIDIRKVSDAEREFKVCAVGARPRQLLADWRFGLSALDGCVQDASQLPRAKPDERPSEADAPGSVRRPDAGDGRLPLSSSSAFSAVGESDPLVLAFDTANEVVAIGVGVLEPSSRRVRVAATREIAAHRASNTTLVPAIEGLLDELGAKRAQIACVCVGRGPGSFTGVRIAMACAKGIASALGVGLIGVSTLDAIAWNAHAEGVRGELLIVADAMRKEVYPARFRLSGCRVERLTSDRVVKADAFAREMAASAVAAPGKRGDSQPLEPLIAGDGLVKYRELLEGAAEVLPEELWEATGRGLLLALQAAWASGEADPFDARRHDPALALPVYTRLSDAEENERIRLASEGERNLRVGVQGFSSASGTGDDVAGLGGQGPDFAPAHGTLSAGEPVPAPDGGKGRATMHSQAPLAAVPDAAGIAYRPLDAASVAAVAQLEGEAMGSDAWDERLVADELGRRDRSWWVAESSEGLVGHAGGLVVDGDLQVLKVAVSPGWRRRGIACELIARVAEDARNLGAQTCSLEVRASNEGAQSFYASLGLAEVGVRPRYYSDREDAVIMAGPLPQPTRDVGGMRLRHLPSEGGDGAWRPAHPATALAPALATAGFQGYPLILAIESSCDETAGAVVDGEGALLSDVVASQIDFHARFGGVVPEIASRKHIEAICGVCAESLTGARIGWRDLDAVAVTYAPGLLGALVVGVAFAKGAAWALDVPLVLVNHLEGHLYANKIDCPGFEPPAVVSLVSGGNTMLVFMRGWGDYEVLGETIDDAVGEAFDKVAKALGLGYPGGPVISRLAAQGDPTAIAFPRPLLHSHDLRFSLSGLKTAVMNHLASERAAARAPSLPDIAASFQQAVVDVQVAKAKAALEKTGAPVLCLGGGVAANPALRKALEELCAKEGVRLVMPPLASCGDNAGMIALVALDRFKRGKFASLDADAQAHANLDEPY